MLFPVTLVLLGALFLTVGATVGSAEAFPVALVAGLTLLVVARLLSLGGAAGRALDGGPDERCVRRPLIDPPDAVIENIVRMHDARLLSDEEFRGVMRGLRSWLRGR